ncbi:hypothetical protein LR48_Vigan04g167600 [Vigna angularis]|uniref:Uncharacterized protein n=1 Tax=Phaseolus angularis TaxID=3914 RepID=A0A0L9UFI1_PHAAN|nr:hypothetical protein LR48_Vigan04g167600 [Vigna angularis]
MSSFGTIKLFTFKQLIRGAHPAGGERDEEKGQQRELGGVVGAAGGLDAYVSEDLLLIGDDLEELTMKARGRWLRRSGDGGVIKGFCCRVAGPVMVMEEGACARRTMVMAARDLEWLRLRSPVDGHGCVHGGEDEDMVAESMEFGRERRRCGGGLWVCEWRNREGDGGKDERNRESAREKEEL